jgi:DNA (cytosine-5)-methyltransferase 1
MEALGKPWVIENVPGAPLGRNVLTLSGQMFGLRVIRRRLFESSLVLLAPDVPTAIGGTNSHRGYSRGAAFVTVGGHNYNVTEGRAAMGIDWMRRAELNDAIPPAYTEFIGRQLLQALRDQP